MLPPLLIVIAVNFMGAAALIPVMYFGVHGWASLWWIWGAAVIGTNITDIIWIAIARNLGPEKIEHWKIIQKNKEKLLLVEKAVKKHGAKILFLSKFIHGTGMLSQLAAGMFKLSWPKALAANFIGAVTWTTIVFLLTRGAVSLPILEAHVANVKIGIIVSICIAVIINIVGIKLAPKEISILANGKNSDPKGNGNV